MKKGFTLIELLAVIVILGIIATIVVPTINDTINNSREDAFEEQKSVVLNAANSREDAFEEQKSVVLNAAKRWGTENIRELPLNNGQSIEKSLKCLKEEGYLNSEKEVIDPTTDEEMNGCVKITYDASNNQYKYEYQSTCSKNEVCS